MYRQSPSRNQRSKGVKVKYAVQICLLLAVSFWLIYQLKRSHDKKKEFDETEAKASLHMHNSNQKNSILGRKGIISQDDEITSMDGDKLHEPIEEDETVEEESKEEEDENKTEEEDETVEEENSKAEEDEDKTEEDESKPDEDESKSEVDEPEEKNVDHEQENPDPDENGQTEGEKSLSEDSDHDGNVDNNKSTHEARDENYKADDASSAVTHEAGENVNEQKENLKEVKKDSEVEGDEIANVDQKSNVVITETNLDALKGSENSSPPNETLIIEKSSWGLEINGSTDVGTENRDLSETNHVMDQDSFNSTDSTGTNNSTYSLPSDSYVESENKTMPLSETEDEMEAEKLDFNVGTNEKLESTVTENPDEEIQHDGIDESDVSELLEEKDVRTDIDTLPEIQTEGAIGDDDVAVE